MKSTVTSLSRRFAARRAMAHERREHDAALAIPRVAAEHATRVERARAHGEHACPHCP